jgi:hypothetical protein
VLPHKKFGAAAAATAAAALVTTAGSAAAHEVSHDFGHWDRGGAVFVQTDSLAGNSIAVYDRHPGGTLTAAGTYATGGNGGQLGLNGIVDEFSVGSGGSLTEVGSVTVPSAVGGEGIATS